MDQRVCPGSCRKAQSRSIWPGSQPVGVCKYCGITKRLTKTLTVRKHHIKEDRWGDPAPSTGGQR